jgi:hypothetical protein
MTCGALMASRFADQPIPVHVADAPAAVHHRAAAAGAKPSRGAKSFCGIDERAILDRSTARAHHLHGDRIEIREPVVRYHIGVAYS